ARPASPMRSETVRLMKSALVATAMSLTLATGTALAEVTLKYGHPNPSESVAGRFADRFAELVKEKTNGEVVINVYPASQLGTARLSAYTASRRGTAKERFEGVPFGLTAFGHASYAPGAQALPALAAPDLPSLSRDVAHAVAATTPATSPVLRELSERLRNGA